MAVKFSPAAQYTRGALVAYLRPRLAMDAKQHCGAMVDKAVQGLTGRNYNQRLPTVINSLKRFTQGRLAQDNGIEDLAALLGALAPEASQMTDQAPGMGQIATNPGGSAGAMSVTPSPDQGGAPPGPPGAPGGAPGGGILELITRYLTEEGVAPEIINNLPAIVSQGGGGGTDNETDPAPIGQLPPGMIGRELAGRGDAADAIIPRTQPGMDQEEIEGEPGSSAMRVMEPRGGATSDFRPESAGDSALDEGHEGHDPWATAEGEDELVPGEQDEQLDGVAQVSSSGTGSRVVNGGASDAVVTRKAMDHAIRVAQDAAIKNQRAIREAERFVRPWVGDIAMDANHPAEVYRAALKAIGVKGADKVHPDALRPILEAQPRPHARVQQQQRLGRSLAMDSAGGGTVTGSFAERFPDAMKVTTMQ